MSVYERLLFKLRFLWLVVFVVVLAVGVGAFFLLKPSSAATVNLVPDFTNSNNWIVSTAGCTSNTTGHTCIDDGTLLNSLDYIGTGTGLDGTLASANFNISNQANVATATQLTLYMNARSVEHLGNTPNADTVTMSLAINGAAVGLSSTKTMTTSFGLHSVTYTGNWTQSEVDNMTATFTRNVVGGGNSSRADDDVQIARVYVEMTYTSPATVTQAAYRWFDNEKNSTGLFDHYLNSTATSPESLAVGDVDGNQRNDVVVAGTNDTITVRRFNTNGSLLSLVDYTTGDAPTSVALADFNGDAKQDIVTANINNASVSILLNNGDGTFATKVDYAAGTTSHSVTTGDFNNDQIIDLAVANDVVQTVSVLLGNGDGTFMTKVDYAAGSNPRSVKVGTFNDDQHDDIIFTSNSNAVTILLNNGDGTFATKAHYPAMSGANSLAVADFNGDSVLDVVVGAATSSVISVLMGNGDGTFATAVDYTGGANSRSIEAGDFNGDQKIDIVGMSSSTDSIAVLMNNGDGTFATKVDYTTGATPWHVAVGELNGDQVVDIVTANKAADTYSTFNSISEYTPLAAKDTIATAPTSGTPFRLRLNLGVTNASLTTGNSYKLRYQEKLDGMCSTNPALYADVSTSTPIRFIDQPSIADKSDYETTSQDPTRFGIASYPQTYNESNPFSVDSTIFANRDGLWDFSLAINTTAEPGNYCLMATKNDNTALNNYAVMPELTVTTPTVEQSSYRLYKNADSTTPGSPLAAQNTSANVAAGEPFRLRQLLRQTAESSVVGTSFKLQAGEKITTCSNTAYQTLSAPVSASTTSTGRVFTASTITGNGWNSLENVKTDNSASTNYPYMFDPAFGMFGPVETSTLKAGNFGLSIPSNATIVGIEYYLDLGTSDNVRDTLIALTKSGTVTAGNNLATNSSLVSRTYGSSTSLWGTTWTPAEINSNEFGLLFISEVDNTNIQPIVNVDSLSVNIYYTIPEIEGAFYDNASTVDGAVIANLANDPTSTSGVVRPQSYSEDESFSVQTEMTNGENGLWDFALQFDESLVGKTYCFRVVNGNDSPLASYAQYPEVTFVEAPTGPTLPQQMRGGQSVVNGQKTPFSW